MKFSDLMKELQNEYQEDFEYLFYHYILSESSNRKNEGGEKFDQLLDIVLQLIINEEGQEVEGIFSFFDKPVRKKLESRFEMAFKIHDLCIYFTSQSEEVGKMIVTYFDNRLRGAKSFPKLKNTEMQDEDLIKDIIEKLVDNAENEELDREGFKGKWGMCFANSYLLLDLLATHYGYYQLLKSNNRNSLR
jgi:hypothetical protein